MSIIKIKEEKIKKEMMRGCGQGFVYDYPIALEPPYEKFTYQVEKPRRGILNLFQKSKTKKNLTITPLVASDDLVITRIRPSPEDEPTPLLFEQFLLSLNPVYPISFEIIGTKEKIVIQMVSRKDDSSVMANNLSTQFPNTEVIQEKKDFLKEAISSLPIIMFVYCLRESHLFPLKNDFKVDPYSGLIGNLNGLSGMAGLQVLFRPAKNDWRQNMLLMARDELDPSKSAFYDLPTLPKLVERKIGKPLWAVSIRIIASDKRIQGQVATFLNQFASEHNGFKSISGDYPQESILGRTNHTPGLILNSEELANLIHIPSPDIHSPKLAKAKRTAPLPSLAKSSSGILLGENNHQGRITPAVVGQEWLTRHMAIFGGTGAGKTNLLGQLFKQFTAHGCGFIDPNGDAAEELLSLVPQDRVQDVIYFNPLDRPPLSLNILETRDRREKEIVCSNLLSSLQRLFDATAWGARMEWILRNTIRTLLASENKTLRDIPLILTNDNFRKKVIFGSGIPFKCLLARSSEFIEINEKSKNSNLMV